MATTTLTPAQVLAPPRRIDWRPVVGLVLMLATIASSMAFWLASSEARGVAVATRDLPAGTILTPSDLSIAWVRIDDSLYQAAIPARDIAELVGRPLMQPVHAQQLLVAAQLSPRPGLGPGEVAMTIPVSPDTAVGGDLQPGQHVRVLATVNKGRPDAKSGVVLARALVYDVGYEARSPLVTIEERDRSSERGPVKWLTLAITHDESVALAQARWAGDLDITLLPPGRGDQVDGAGSGPPG